MDNWNERIARRNAIARLNGYYELPTVSAIVPSVEPTPIVNTSGIDLHSHLEYIQTHDDSFVIRRHSVRGYCGQGLGRLR